MLYVKWRKLVKESCLAGLKDNSKDLASLFYNTVRLKMGSLKKKKEDQNQRSRSRGIVFFSHSSSLSNLLATGLCRLCRYPQAKMRSGLLFGKPSPFKLHTPIFFLIFKPGILIPNWCNWHHLRQHPLEPQKTYIKLFSHVLQYSSRPVSRLWRVKSSPSVPLHSVM